MSHDALNTIVYGLLTNLDQLEAVKRMSATAPSIPDLATRMTNLGAYQIAQNVDLANLRAGSRGGAVGGAMDLVHGARLVPGITDHVTRDGKFTLVERCTFLLTGVACVTRVYPSLAVVDIENDHFELREKVPDISMPTLQSLTGAVLHTDGKVTNLLVPEIDA